MKWEEWEIEMREKRSQAPPLKELETTIHQDIFGQGLRQIGQLQIGQLQAGERVPLNEFSVPEYTRSIEGCRAIAQRLYAAHDVTIRCYLEDFGTHFERWEVGIHTPDAKIAGEGAAKEFGLAVALGALEFHRNWQRRQTDEAIKRMTGEQ